MLAEMQLSTDTQAYILGNGLKCFNPFEKHHGNMLKTIKMFACIPINLYQGNNSKIKAIGTKTFPAGLFVVNYENINIK